MNLTSLTSDDFKQILKLRQQIEKLEKELLSVFKHAERRPITKEKPGSIVRQQQPSLRDLISGILRKARNPMSVQDIYEATLMAGYHWRSQEPINALNVKMYTDKTFKKVGTATFVLRKG